MLLEHEFNVQNRRALRALLQPQPFAVVDPDADGAIMVYDHKSPMPRAVFSTILLGDAVRSAQDLGVRLVVVEAQFLKFSPMTSVRLARRAMMFPAALAGATYGTCQDPVSLMWVFATTWLAWLRGNEGKQLKRGEGKALSRAYAETLFARDSRWVNANEARQQGMADAAAIGGWVRHAFWGMAGGPGRTESLL